LDDYRELFAKNLGKCVGKHEAKLRETFLMEGFAPSVLKPTGKVT